MNLEGRSFPGLQVVPVELSGDWRDGTTRDWLGTASSRVPLVGMSFLESRAHCEWCKSERDEASPQVRLAMFPYDDYGLDVQVSFSVAHGQCRWRSSVASSSYRPVIPQSQMLDTARIYRFASLAADPAIRVFILFLARADVESSRKTLWRVRKRLESLLEEPFRQWLTHGRTGTNGG